MNYGEEVREGEVIPDSTPVPMVAPDEFPAETPAPDRERDPVEV